MLDPFVGEICLFAFPRVPIGWLACNGQVVQIDQYQTLYTLIGTAYGGDGMVTFGLPDLRGRVPIHAGTSNQGNTYVLGQPGGEENHTLSALEMAAHSHALVSTTNAGTTAVPATSVHLAASNVATKPLYAPTTGIAGYDVMADCISYEGGSQPHDNMMPSLVMNFCIATDGVFPS
jgi:microcystin-dependent protein